MGLKRKSGEALGGRHDQKTAEMRGFFGVGGASTVGLKGLQGAFPALHLPPRSYQRSGAGPQDFESVGGEA